MPRKPDIGLEVAILDSALGLLDEAGVEAVKMREVAKRARTTTPTLYERFQDREALLWGVVARVQDDLLQCVRDAESLERMAEILLGYFAKFPGRLDLMNQYWPRIMGSDHPKPVLEFARKKFSSAMGDERAFSLMALLIGTAMMMHVAGQESPVSNALRNSSLKAARVLCREM